MKRLIVSVVAVVGLLAACSTPEESMAELTRQAPMAMRAAPADFLVVAPRGFARGFERAVERAGDELGFINEDAGIAVVTTADPRAYQRYGVVAENLRFERAQDEIVESAVFEDDYADPPFSGDDDFFFDLQWGHDAVNATEAWNAGARGAGARVAVLDGGFDLDHPDLAPNINLDLSENFVVGEDLQYGIDDLFSHGSHVAGTIAAADNGFGVIGVAPEAELVLVKVLGDAGTGSFADVIAGILYAADVEADVINMSLGALIFQGIGPGANEVAALRVAVNQAINYANQSGATVIVSAGNAALDLNEPENASLVNFNGFASNAVSISATAPIGWATDPGNISLTDRSVYTNVGPEIDFAAPGGDSVYPGNEGCTIAGLLQPCWVFDLVFSTGNGGWYWSSGTSMAAPHAAGIAALIIGENGGGMKPSHVVRDMRQRAEDLGKRGSDDVYGWGHVTSGY